MSLGVIGASSTIARSVARDCRPDVSIYSARYGAMPLNLDRYLICAGFLAGKSVEEISVEDAAETFRVNFIEPARFCTRVFAANPKARICLIGSESGFKGSYDMAYAGAKAALHLFIETHQLASPDQMLVGIAPHIIWDSGMTQRRVDRIELEARGAMNRMGRWLNPKEVAEIAVHLLFHASPSISGSVIRMRP